VRKIWHFLVRLYVWTLLSLIAFSLISSIYLPYPQADLHCTGVGFGCAFEVRTVPPKGSYVGNALLAIGFGSIGTFLIFSAKKIVADSHRNRGRTNY
jgi:hypothetical protein